MFQFFQVTHFYQIEYLSGHKLAFLANLPHRDLSFRPFSRFKRHNLTLGSTFFLSVGDDHPAAGQTRSIMPRSVRLTKLDKTGQTTCLMDAMKAVGTARQGMGPTLISYRKLDAKGKRKFRFGKSCGECVEAL